MRQHTESRRRSADHGLRMTALLGAGFAAALVLFDGGGAHAVGMAARTAPTDAFPGNSSGIGTPFVPISPKGSEWS